MGLVCGKDLRVIHMLVNGSMGNLMVMVFMFGRMAIIMKDSSKIHWNMGLEYKNLLMETFIKAHI